MIGSKGFDGGCPLCCFSFAVVCFLLEGYICALSFGSIAVVRNFFSFGSIAVVRKIFFPLVRLRLSARFFFPFGSIAVVRKIFFWTVSDFIVQV